LRAFALPLFFFVGAESTTARAPFHAERSLL
jgi:hypothetical protein